MPLIPSTLVDSQSVIDEGRALARDWKVVPSSFLREHNVASEFDFKCRQMNLGRVMTHAQIGFRNPQASQDAWRRIYEGSMVDGISVDRYGICLDWSMGYPRADRAGRPRGTGLILDSPESFAALTAQAPVAPHFGDFVLGMPSAVENTCAALSAGATSIGNIGQYFTFRLPGWSDDVQTTVATVKAIALAAHQPVPVLIHSNLDDGFASLFTDLSCALGAALLEKYIVNELIGGTLASHCYGHTFSDGVSRLAFQRALARINDTPGSMIYGNTTIYDDDETANYASLASYLLVDIAGQKALPTGHAINAVPVTEAQRIPTVEEIIAAQRFARRLIDRSESYQDMVAVEAADRIADTLIDGGERFKMRVVDGLREAGVDTEDAVALLLALRRTGAAELEREFGPGAEDAEQPRGRRALVVSPVGAEIDQRAEQCMQQFTPDQTDRLKRANLKACVATTDVHEFAKILLERVFGQVGIELIDAGVSVDPDTVSALAAEGGADFIALSTYNGVALSYARELRKRLATGERDIPLYIGGRLNEIVEHDSGDDGALLPRDVSVELAGSGVLVCNTPADLLNHLLDFVLAPMPQ